MGTTEFDLLNKLRQAEQLNPDPLQQRLRQRSQTIEEESAESDREAGGGFFSQLVKGAAVGALEPLGFLPPVSRFLDAHVAPETPHVGQKIGYALGWIGGLAVPATAALKISATGLRAANVIRAADAMTDLGLKGNLLRGSLAGALLGAGRDAEDGGDRLKNMAAEAALFGIGDAVAFPIMRAISGASLGRGSPRALAELDKIRDAGMVDTVDGAELLGRASRLLDELIPEDHALSDLTLGTRKEAMRVGLSRLGLPDLARGEVRIIPSLRADASDISGILQKLPEIDYQVIVRSKRGKLDTSDVLIAPSGSLDERLVSVYRQNLERHGVGFFPGQTARWKGADRIVKGITQGGKLELYLPGTGARVGSRAGTAFADPSEVLFLPHGTWRSGPASVPNAAGEWINFIKEYGEFPDDFEAAFRATAERLALDEPQAQQLHEYFTTRLFESLSKIDKPVTDVLSKLRKSRPEKHPDGHLAELGAQAGYIVGHDIIENAPTAGQFTVAKTVGIDDVPTSSKQIAAMEADFKSLVGIDDDFRMDAGRLILGKSQTKKGQWMVGVAKAGTEAIEELEVHKSFATARQTFVGMLSDPDLVEGASRVRLMTENPIKQGGQLVTTIRDARTGNRIIFATDEAAAAYIRENPLKLPDLTQGIPSPLPKNSMGLSGASVMPDHTAVDIANARITWPMAALTLPFAERLLPRAAFLRMMDDMLLKQGIETDVFSTWSRLQQSQVRARNAGTPWVERLTKLRDRKIKPENLPLIRNALLRPESEIDDLVKRGLLTDTDATAARDLKTYMRDLFDDINKNDKWAIDADEFMEEYLPYIVTKPPEKWKDALTQNFKSRGMTPNKRLLKFAEEMERAGINPGRHEQDPFMVALRWTTTAFTKRHVDPAFRAAREVLENLPHEGITDVIRRSLSDSIKVAYQGAPEAYYVARVAADGYFKNLGIKLEERDFDRLVATLISMNYGAFMGFRPALALRNLTESLVTALPMIQSPKHMAYGYKHGVTKAGRDEAFKALAITADNLGAPFEDHIAREAMYNRMKKSAAGPVVGTALKAFEKGESLARMSLGGTLEIAGREIPVGLYGRTDQFTRAIAWHAQKSKVLEAVKKWRGADGHGNLTRFNEDAGLTMFGEAQTREFHKILSQDGTMEAVRWIATQAANETSWIYQQGAGPALFSQGMGRLFGMYGTWPSWYASHLIRGATKGTARDKARFWAWTAAVTGTFTGMTYATGINFSKWSPLGSLTWTGGPAFDWFKDYTDIVSGATPPGQPPRANRALALAQRGIRDTGDRAPIPFLGHLDPRKGKGLDIEDPLRAGRDLFYLFTPGAGQVRDILRAPDEPTLGKALLRGAGFDPVAGHAWPQVQVR